MLKKGNHIHLIGIGGAGLSAIARVLYERGFTISGSDRSPSPMAEALRDMGVQVSYGHHGDHVENADLVIRSSAVPMDNVEVVAALGKGIPVLRRAEFIPELVSGSRVIGIAGTHGKTTTTSMIAWVLADQGMDPSFIIGGEPANFGTNARSGWGEYFVIEADEYDWMFHGLRPEIAVITNIEHDHPDLFPTAAEFQAAFDHFADLITSSGTLIAWGDSEITRGMLTRIAGSGRQGIAYGQGPENDLRAVALEPVAGAGYAFDVLAGTSRLGRIELQVPGAHNVLNALAAAAVGLHAGLSFEAIARSLGRFSGVGRRFEVLGQAGDVIVVDDYAHHPTEIRATIAAARGRYPGRQLWVTWQPHTYSRIQLMCSEFAAAFAEADHVILTDVFAAREQRPPNFSLDGLLAKMGHPDARKIDDLADAAAYLNQNIKPGSVLLVLSAGDATQVSRDVLENIKNRNP